MSFLFEIIRLGLNNLRLHKLRSVLTSLGIILGVAAVIVMVSIGEGNKQAALRRISAFGATNIIVRSQPPPESTSYSQERTFVANYGITRKDLRRLEKNLGDEADIIPLKSVGDELSHQGSRTLSQAFGTTPRLLEVANLSLEPRSRYITAEDIESRASVAVIGSEIARKFFRLRDPLGAQFRIGQRVFTVVGVLRPVGLAGGAGTKLVGRDWNKDVHIPITTAKAQFGDTVFRRQSGSFSGEEVELSEIYINTDSTQAVIPTADRVKRIFVVGHPELTDIELIVPWELLEEAKRTQMIWNVIFIAIAAISLLVGGIGIMNIMLASVTERTREIGIRRALGATRRHIVAQFLVETGSLSAVGGLLGIAVGIGLSVAVGQGLQAVLALPAVREHFGTSISLETQVTLWSIIASFVVATAVGLIFGIYPAIIASKQDPIVALRHD